MKRRLFLIFNHKITPLQAEDARRSLQVDCIVDLPDDLKPVWNRIPPDLTEIREHLRPINNWLAENAESGDYVLIQGDFGACYLMVNFAFEKGFVPIYSTTLREAVEKHLSDGSVKLTHQFKHFIFRKYGE